MDDNNKELIKYGALALVALILLYYIKQMITGAGKAVGESIGLSVTEETTKQDAQRLDSIPVDKKKLSLSTQSYTNMAAQLYNAMQGTGTDHNTVVAVINAMKNQNEWNATIKAFGIKDGQNLIGWLRSEYRGSVNDAIKNAKYILSIGAKTSVTANTLNGILKRHGITQNLI
jgi:hypothetical protein